MSAILPKGESLRRAVRHISDRVAVMYLGKIVEMGPCVAVFDVPRHPYTKALISAVPVVDPDSRKQRIILKGDVPSPIDPPRGCPFHTRCPEVMEKCSQEVPPVERCESSHWYRCYLKT